MCSEQRTCIGHEVTEVIELIHGVAPGTARSVSGRTRDVEIERRPAGAVVREIEGAAIRADPCGVVAVPDGAQLLDRAGALNGSLAEARVAVQMSSSALPWPDVTAG